MNSPVYYVLSPNDDPQLIPFVFLAAPSEKAAWRKILRVMEGATRQSLEAEGYRARRFIVTVEEAT